MVRKTVISQLASVSEGALAKVASSGATKQALQGAMHLKDRGEKIIHGLESVEDRLLAIEQRLETLEQATKPRRTVRRAATPKPPKA
ncbi:MAG: hypothetical protein WCH31_08200 [Actinomycetes bacterium]